MRLPAEGGPSTSGGAAESTSSMCVQPSGGAVDAHNDRRCGTQQPSIMFYPLMLMRLPL